MMHRIRCSFVVAVCLGVARMASAGTTAADFSNPIEDVAYQVVHRLNADERVCAEVKNIAFAKLDGDNGTTALVHTADLSTVFETALAAVPGKLKFVAHASHDADWILIDEIFKQARDMSSWDPKTCPELKKLKLCDALLLGRLVWLQADAGEGVVVAKMALRLIKVSTGEELWGAVIEGRHTLGGPDNEEVSLNWRRALEACAANAVEKLPKSLEGYGVLILPIEGKTGAAMEQVFLNALTAAKRQDAITVYDLPRGNVQDRMFARFLSNRGSDAARDENFERRSIGQYVTAHKMPTKLAVLSGRVSVVNENPKFQLDASGLPVDFLGGAKAVEAQLRKSYEIVCDFKFRDVNDSFRLIGSIGATGIYEPAAPVPTLREKILKAVHEIASLLGDGAVSRILKIILALVVLFVARRMIRKVISGMSRPR